jgi:hypothetical protein
MSDIFAFQGWAHPRLQRRPGFPGLHKLPVNNPLNIPVRRFAKHPLIFPVKLGGIFVTYRDCRATGILIFRQHKPVRFVKAEAFLVLKGAYVGQTAKIPVKSRGGHINHFCQCVDIYRLVIMSL